MQFRLDRAVETFTHEGGGYDCSAVRIMLAGIKAGDVTAPQADTQEYRMPN